MLDIDKNLKLFVYSGINSMIGWDAGMYFLPNY